MRTKPLALLLIVLTACLTLAMAHEAVARDRDTGRYADLEMIFFQSPDYKFHLYGIKHARKDFPDTRLQAAFHPMDVDKYRASIKRVTKSSSEGLAVNVIDAEKLDEELAEAASKTPLVTFEYDARRGLSKTFVGHDEFTHGWYAAQLIRRAAEDQTPVHLFTQIGHPHAEARVDGIKRGLRGAKIKITETHDNGQDAEATGKKVRKILATTEGAIVLVGVWHNSKTILDAVREEGRKADVKIVCFERSQEVFDGIKNGDIVGTVLQDPHRLVYETARILRAHALGEKPKTTHPGAHAVRGGIVDQNNLEAYLKYQQSIFDNKDEVDFFAFNPKDGKRDEKNKEIKAGE